MRNVEDIMTVINSESNNRKINILEEIQIVRAAKSVDILNDVINGKNEPLYILLSPVDRIQIIIAKLKYKKTFK